MKIAKIIEIAIFLDFILFSYIIVRTNKSLDLIITLLPFIFFQLFSLNIICRFYWEEGRFSDSFINTPTGIVFVGQGNIYVADAGNHNVLVFIYRYKLFIDKSQSEILRTGVKLDDFLNYQL